MTALEIYQLQQTKAHIIIIVIVIVIIIIIIIEHHFDCADSDTGDCSCCLTFSVREPSVRQPIVTPPYTKAVGPTPFTL